jgi:hypothetical protein
MPAYSQALAANKPEILKAEAFPGQSHLHDMKVRLP